MELREEVDGDDDRPLRVSRWCCWLPPITREDRVAVELDLISTTPRLKKVTLVNPLPVTIEPVRRKQWLLDSLRMAFEKFGECAPSCALACDPEVARH